jgi:hypothetical protein
LRPRKLLETWDYEDRADAYAKEGEWDKAVEDLTTAISLQVGGKLILSDIQEFRALYPEYAAASDEMIAHKLHGTFFPDWKYKDFALPAPKGTRPPNAGKGRPKGAANKMNQSLRDMILGALDDAGGQAYLAEQAHKNPAAFLTLLGRVLPREPRLRAAAGRDHPGFRVDAADAYITSSAGRRYAPASYRQRHAVLVQ